jgi:hypothetical protein
MLERGEVEDLADLARREGLTRARITQLVSLTLIAPDIQEEILSLPPVAGGRGMMIPARALRELVRSALWSEQRTRWRALRALAWRCIDGA